MKNASSAWRGPVVAAARSVAYGTRPVAARASSSYQVSPWRLGEIVGGETIERLAEPLGLAGDPQATCRPCRSR